MPEPLNALVGATIRGRRTSIGLSQAALAEALELSRTSVTNIESGRQPLSIVGLFQVARALGVPPADLLPEDTDAAVTRGRRSREVRSLLGLLEPIGNKSIP